MQVGRGESQSPPSDADGRHYWELKHSIERLLGIVEHVSKRSPLAVFEKLRPCDCYLCHFRPAPDRHYKGNICTYKFRTCNICMLTGKQKQRRIIVNTTWSGDRADTLPTVFLLLSASGGGQLV